MSFSSRKFKKSRQNGTTNELNSTSTATKRQRQNVKLLLKLADFQFTNSSVKPGKCNILEFFLR
jgi:hypothetical protein